jgi:molecular chaperone DnaK
MSDVYIGIDLGTTETTVSVIERDNKREDPIDKLRTLSIYQFNKMHEYDKDNTGLQSSIYIDRDQKKLYTGEYAKSLYSAGNRPLNTIRSVKTRIGGESMIQVPLDSDPSDLKSYGMTELTAVLLKTLYDSLTKQLTSHPVDVTVTIPAGFNSDERNETLLAAKLAGFKDVNLLDEPTAVLLNFLNSDSTDSLVSDDFFDIPKKVLVFDLGGGTLDISIAEVEDDGDFDVDILGRSKRMDFGGDDIDKYIASYFLSEFEKINPSIEERTEEEQAIIVSRIVSQAEKSKVEFSKKISKCLDHERRRSRVKESVNFEIIDSLKITDITLTDELLKNILSNVISSNGLLINPIKKCLDELKMDKSEIDLVILTGGSSKFYLTDETLTRYFGNDCQIVDFTERIAVSKGAAIHSFNQTTEDLKHVNIDDVMSDSVFIKRGDKFELLVPHDVELPTKGTYEYKFDRPTNKLDLFLYYGVESDEKYKYKEIAGVFHNFGSDRHFEKNQKINIDWGFDSNKIIKLFFENKELLSSGGEIISKYELLNDFNLNNNI